MAAKFIVYYSAFAFARFPISGGQRITESESVDHRATRVYNNVIKFLQ